MSEGMNSRDLGRIPINEKQEARAFLEAAGLLRIEGAGPNPFAPFLRALEHPDPAERAEAQRLYADFETNFIRTVKACRAHSLSESMIGGLIADLLRPTLDSLLHWAEARVRQCEQCGDFFFPERSTGKYCGDRCRKAAQRKREITVKDNALTLA